MTAKFSTIKRCIDTICRRSDEGSLDATTDARKIARFLGALTRHKPESAETRARYLAVQRNRTAAVAAIRGGRRN